MVEVLWERHIGSVMFYLLDMALWNFVLFFKSISVVFCQFLESILGISIIFA